ncbi:MAG: hypothetical protein LBS28_05240 [Streptococcaceae bacterium]|jgi:hypothetical protein|nr:hypothetical protein [Streptococcaceae bacterium]
MLKEKSSLLFKLRHRDNLLNLYNKKIKKEENNVEKEGSILITSIGCSPSMSMHEGLYARKAIINGIKVYNLFCDQFLNKCEIVSAYLKLKRIRCNFCRNFQQQFLNSFETIACYYNEILDESDLIIVKKKIEHFIKDNKNEYIFLNVEVKSILYTSLQRYYLIADPVIKVDKITKSFLFNIFCTLIVMDKLCQKINPKYVLSTQGVYSLWGSVVEYCKANAVKVITLGRSYNNEGLMVALGDSYLKKFQNNISNNWKNQLAPEKKVLVKKFYDSRIEKLKRKFSHEYSENNKQFFFSKKKVCNILKIDINKKIVALLPNVTWDGQVCSSNSIYPLFRDWIKETIEYFKNIEDSILIIRAHPLETNKRYWVGKEKIQTIIYNIYNKLPNNVILLSANSIIDSYSLGVISNFILTMTSTIALEMTYLMKPVLIIGDSPFKNKGIGFDINSKKQYFETMARGLKDGLIVSENQIINLYKFSYYYFFKIVMPETLIELKNNIPLNFKFKNEKELNSNLELEYLYRCIVSNTEPDFSEFYNENDYY